MYYAIKTNKSRKDEVRIISPEIVRKLRANLTKIDVDTEVTNKWGIDNVT